MKKFDFDGIGRVSAIVSSIILMAIWLNVWVLNTSAHESNNSTNTYAHLQETPQLVHSIEQDLPTDEQNETMWIHNIISQVKPEPKQAVAYFYADDLYAISLQGKVLALADSMQHQNLPIVTGMDIQNVEPGMIIHDEKMTQALLLIQSAAKNKLIAPLISEVRGQENGDLVVYFNWGRLVPVRMGSGNWSNKLDRLCLFYQQLGNHDLTRNAKYLDLRVQDRIIVKKNV